MSLPPKSERARGPKYKFRLQNTYLLLGPGELETTSSYRDNARDYVIFENYRSLTCGVIDSQSMTRECHANCNITLLLDPKSAEWSEVAISHESVGNRTRLPLRVVCDVAGLVLAEIAGLGELIEPGVSGVGVEHDG